jgi:hypothetical protein
MPDFGICLRHILCFMIESPIGIEYLTKSTTNTLLYAGIKIHNPNFGHVNLGSFRVGKKCDKNFIPADD